MTLFHKKILFIFIPLALLYSVLIAQQEIDTAKYYFISPLNIPLKLAGNFGEIRSNHFHSGIDIKTDSVEGKNVVAVADGYIVRIKISPYGFGNALYINHPKGYTTVYGHLQKFNDTLAAYARSVQLEKMSFDIDVTLDSNLFLVKQGDIIALSGNSGSSSGPHLHFEIRDTKSEKIINPQLFGLKFYDTIPPKIKTIAVYEDKIFRDKISVTELNPNTFAITDTLKVTRNARFGFTAFDLSDDGKNKLGIFDAKFYINDSLIWQYNFNTFSFDETKYANAHKDYAQYVLSEELIERCYLLPNNKFSLFKVDSPAYKPNFPAKKINEARLVLTDVVGNQSDLLFHFKASKIIKPFKPEKEWVRISYVRPYKLKTEKMLLQIPSGALYDNIWLQYHVTKKVKPLLSQLHHVNDNTIPLHSAAAISIKAPNLKPELNAKLCIASINDLGIIEYEGGLYKNGFVSANIYKLGTFAIKIDSMSPFVIDMQAGDTLFSRDSILKYQIHDDFSGISKYKVFINQEQIIATYDAKKFMVLIPCKSFIIGENELEIYAEDKKQNSKSFKRKIKVQ